MSSAPSKFPRVLGAPASRGFVLMVAIVTVAVVVSLILANVYSSDMSGRATAVAPPATNASPSLAVPIVLTTPNLVENGGFEASVSLWGARAPNTFVRSTRLAKTGKASGLATRDVRTADTDAANFRMALGAGRTYALSCWLYVPSSYSGADVQLNPEWVGTTSVTAAVADSETSTAPPPGPRSVRHAGRFDTSSSDHADVPTTVSQRTKLGYAAHRTPVALRGPTPELFPSCTAGEKPD